jgi:hypothetical protein
VLGQRHARRAAGKGVYVASGLGSQDAVALRYFVVGIMNSAPARMPDGHRCVTAFCRV